MKYVIYQLKREEDCPGNSMRLFNSMRLNQSLGLPVEPERYEPVYEGIHNGVSMLDHINMLEWVFRKFNTDHPHDFRGHSLSVSDIVVLYGTRSDAYYCDSIGWVPVPDFYKAIEKGA